MRTSSDRLFKFFPCLTTYFFLSSKSIALTFFVGAAEFETLDRSDYLLLAFSLENVYRLEECLDPCFFFVITDLAFTCFLAKIPGPLIGSGFLDLYLENPVFHTSVFYLGIWRGTAVSSSSCLALKSKVCAKSFWT